MNDTIRIGTFFINDIEFMMDIEEDILFNFETSERISINKNYILMPMLFDKEEDIEIKYNKDIVLKELQKILNTSNSNLAFEVISDIPYLDNNKENIKEKTFERLNKMLLDNNRKIYIKNIKEIL